MCLDKKSDACGRKKQPKPLLCVVLCVLVDCLEGAANRAYHDVTILKFTSKKSDRCA